MVGVHTLNKETNQLKHMIEKKISHSYVEKYIQKPLIDYDKLYVLHYLYKDLEISSTKKQQYMTTIMLVQIALDTHELVPSRNSNCMNNIEKQLAVLAGDYYSGLYYLLLSEIEDIDMIQILATAIQKINEKKMILFYENVQTIDELVETLKDIESILFTDVASFLNVSYELIPIIKELLLINRLQKEKEMIETDQFSPIEDYLRKNLSNTSYPSVITELEDKIDLSKRALDKLSSDLPYRFLSLKNMITNKIKLSYNTSIAEEG